VTVGGSSAIKGDVYLARAFAKNGDYVLLVIAEVMINSTPQHSIAGNSFLDAYRWIKVLQDLGQNSIIDEVKKEDCW
jgi:hypothetical protein